MAPSNLPTGSGKRLSAVWGFAIASGVAKNNPAAGITKALKPIVRQGRRAAVTSLDNARDAITRAEATPAHPVTRLALRLLALTAVRPGELRHATWGEFNGDVWTIPGVRMKHTQARAAQIPDHVVPLSSHALAVLEALRPLTGKGALCFPSATDAGKPISENAIGYLLNRAGFAGRQTAHGWRATFSSLMNERNPADRDVIEAMLAHTPKDAVAAAYNRTSYAARRREIAQEWGDLLMAGVAAPVTLKGLPRK